MASSKIITPNRDLVLPHNFTPREYQRGVWEYLENGGTRALTVWHRRCGKDLTAMHYTACASQERVGLYLHVFPFYSQGRKIAWEGRDKEGKAFLDAFPMGMVDKKIDHEMKIIFKNGSIYRIAGTDNADSLVGTNPIGLLMSEYSIQDPWAWDYMRPILAENDGWAWFLYTPRGKNHGFDLFTKASTNKKWFCQRLTVDDTKRADGSPVIGQEIIEEERADGMSDELIEQEFYCSFEAGEVGSYYNTQIGYLVENQRVTNVPWEPLLEVNTYWDLGMDDSTTIWFEQKHGNEIRLIDYYENSGEGLVHYVNYLKSKPYFYGKHWFPHDIKVRELGTGTSRLEVLHKMGIKCNIVPRLSVTDGIEAVRNILPKCWFDSKSRVKQTIGGPYEGAGRGFDSLKGYKKEYDEKAKVYRNKPDKNWAIHGADSFRMLAVANDLKKEEKNKVRPTHAIMNYDII